MCSKIEIGSSPRILITRLSAIGDCVHTLPLLHALRQRYANAHIAWATQKAGAELIQGHPELNEVILIARDWYRSWRSIRETRSRLQSGRFDLSIDPQSLTKSSLIAWLGLTNDPLMGIFRHADAGYEDARRCAAEHDVRIPMDTCEP